MSSTKRVTNIAKLINAGSMTGTSVLTGTSVDLSSYDNVGLLFKWTGTPNGTFVVSGSVDGTTFDDLKPTAVDGSALTATGAAGNHTVNLNGLVMKNVKVTYTNSSSTGTLDVSIVAKEG